MKQCSECKRIKPLFEFHKSKRSKNGHVGVCKLCRSAIAKQRYSNPEYRERILKQQRKKYKSDPAVRKAKKEYIEKYRSDPKIKKRYREYNKWYSQTPKGKRISKRSRAKNAEQKPYTIKAKTAVNNAVAQGKLQPISEQKCRDCGNQAENYHHWSYKSQHWLDVIPLCRQCHIDIHKETNQ